MAEKSAPVAVQSSAPKKVTKKAAGGLKKPKTKPTHPPTAIMVNAAIKSLKERGGSSLSAIKKYLASNYKVDVEKLSPFIKKYLKTSVTSGKLIQTKGKGATGSFKLSASEKKVKTEKPKVAKKSSDKKVKKSAAKKTAKAAKKTGTVKAKAPKEKSTKKTSKVIKTKAPKPKKAAKSA